MKVLQVNAVLNSGSTGRIAEEIGKLLISNGDQSIIAYGREGTKSSSRAIKIGAKPDFYRHIIKSRVLDQHGFGSENPTKFLVSEIEALDPDLIHLHNIHGYYLNVEILFRYLKKAGKPVVWTFHDCWPFTGHCSHFDFVNCQKWRTGCYQCPNIHAYPRSWFRDNSSANYERKKELFTGMLKMLLVSPSEWLADKLRNSFLREYEIQIISNGVDLQLFKPYDKTEAIRRFNLNGKRIVLGVASVWTVKKGLNDFIKLQSLLDDIQIVLIGLSEAQIKELPEGIRGIRRTESIEDLARLYSAADVFVNPTYVDNFPTTNIEALACGTPVITYNTGGSPEAVDDETGRVVEKGDIAGIVNSINDLNKIEKEHISAHCRKRAENLFNKDYRYLDYLQLYEKLV